MDFVPLIGANWALSTETTLQFYSFESTNLAAT